MERSKIPMLSRFDVISHIMPYYGQTHGAFLLLSSLCSASRRKLDEFYDEFVIHMREYWRYLLAYSTDQKTHNFLPNDLFEIFVDLKYRKSIKTFIGFIESLRDSEGWYFNNHYMHSKVKIRDPIEIDINDIKKLHAYVYVLKSTQVILCKKDTHSFKVEYESTTLDTNFNQTLLILKRFDINM